jgi:hypothetical protein
MRVQVPMWWIFQFTYSFQPHYGPGVDSALFGIHSFHIRIVDGGMRFRRNISINSSIYTQRDGDPDSSSDQVMEFVDDKVSWELVFIRVLQFPLPVFDPPNSPLSLSFYH